MTPCKREKSEGWMGGPTEWGENQKSHANKSKKVLHAPSIRSVVSKRSKEQRNFGMERGVNRDREEIVVKKSCFSKRLGEEPGKALGT